MPAKSEIIEEFGSIQTQRNAKIKFYIDKFHNILYANIREFIEGKNYTGPTRKGVKLNMDELSKVHECIKSVNLEDPQIKDKELARIEKNSIKDIVLKAADYKGKVGLDIREWLKTDEYKGWTKNGVRIEKSNFDTFKQYIEQMCSKFKDLQQSKS